MKGWQRLWVVVAVIWILPVIAVTYERWPQAESITNVEVFAHMNPQDRLPIDEAATLNEWKLGGMSDDAAASAMERIPSVLVDGRRFRFGDPEDFARFTAAFDLGLKQALTSKRKAFSGEAFAAWAMPLAALYTLGWAVRWVRRGFSANCS